MEIYYPSNIGLGISSMIMLQKKAQNHITAEDEKVGNPLNLFVSFYCCSGRAGDTLLRDI